MSGRKYLTHLEVEKLVAATAAGKNQVRDKCMWVMCFIQGHRVSEWIKLRSNDIEMTTKIIHIYRIKKGISVKHQ